MSDTSQPAPHVPLGVGKIVSESFTLLFGNIVAVAVAAFIPILFSLVLSGAFMGFGVVFGSEVADFQAEGFAFGIVLSTVVSIAIYGVITAIIVQLAYDAKLGRGTNFYGYAQGAIQTLIPNILLTLAISLIAALGMIALIIPGLWLYAVFAVTIPALVIERVGYGAMGRSAELTKEYRWPILGTILIVGIAASILNYIPAFLIGWVFGSLGGASTVIVVLLASLLYTLSYGLISIVLSLIYARLREIKDGVGVDNLAKVFE